MLELQGRVHPHQAAVSPPGKLHEAFYFSSSKEVTARKLILSLRSLNPITSWKLMGIKGKQNHGELPHCNLMVCASILGSSVRDGAHDGVQRGLSEGQGRV